MLQAFIGPRDLIDRQSAMLRQVVVPEFMQRGHFAGYVRRMRQLHRQQRGALVGTLARRSAGVPKATMPDQGMHLLGYSSDDLSEIALEATARHRSPLDQRLLPRSAAAI